LFLHKRYYLFLEINEIPEKRKPIEAERDQLLENGVQLKDGKDGTTYTLE